MNLTFNKELPIHDWANEEGIAEEEIHSRLVEETDKMAAARAANIGPEIMRQVEKSLMLQILDQHWRDHLLTLEHLRQVVGLRGYGQRDPLSEYKSGSDFLVLLKTKRRSMILKRSSPRKAGFKRSQNFVLK